MLSILHTRDNSVSSEVKSDFKGNELKKTMPPSQHSPYRETDEGMNVYVGCVCVIQHVCVCVWAIGGRGGGRLEWLMSTVRARDFLSINAASG